MPPREQQPAPTSQLHPSASLVTTSDPSRTHSPDSRLPEAQQTEAKASKSLKDRLWGLTGKKEDKETMEKIDAPLSASAAPPVRVPEQRRPADLQPSAQNITISPARIYHQPPGATSPARLRSSSPRLHSPASSEIFERNVQEPIPISTLGNEVSDAHIPAHVLTEDSIPPALEASAEAITSKSLDLDEVEIVTSASHQPAASLLEGSTNHTDVSSLPSPTATLRHELSVGSEASSSLHASGIIPGIEDDGASNYGQLDPNDVRRLSFISFKDIVHSEHQQMAASGDIVGNRDSQYIGNHSMGSIGERAASPLRQTRSSTPAHNHSLSGGVSTAPPGVQVNRVVGYAEQSPVRSIPGNQHGELTIETMRQSIRKTASGDLSGVRAGSESIRSTGMSPVNPVGGDELLPAPPSRTNS